VSLADRLASAEKPRTLAQWHAALPAKDQKAFNDWLRQGLPVAELHRQCSEEGLEVSASNFRHFAQQLRQTLESR
jgi:hypothetical protein